MAGSNKQTGKMEQQKELYEKIIALKYSVDSMASIVQNPVDEIQEEEVNEWNEDINKLVNTINKLKLDVLEFYNKQ